MPESTSPQLDRVEVKLAELEGKLDVMHTAVDKMRKYMLFGFWLTVAMIVMPLILFPLVVGPFLASLGAGSGL